MKLRLPKIKFIKKIFTSAYINILLFLIAVSVLSILGMFLYKNLYQTIAQTEQIILLKQEVAPYSLNMTKVNSVLEFLDQKHSTTTQEVDWDEINNPFQNNSNNTEIQEEVLNKENNTTPEEL